MEKYINAKKFMQYLDDMETMGFSGCAFYGLREYIEKNSEDIAPVVHGQIIWKERHRGGFKTAKCLHSFNDINTENNIPCKHIAKIDERYTINEPYCSKCGKLLGDFLNYCGNCGAKMDGDKNE